jgi:hypothetical protein
VIDTSGSPYELLFLLAHGHQWWIHTKIQSSFAKIPSNNMKMERMWNAFIYDSFLLKHSSKHILIFEQNFIKTDPTILNDVIVTNQNFKTKNYLHRIRDQPFMCHNPDSKFLNWQRMYNLLPFSGREIDGCKVASKYTTDFLPVLYIIFSLCFRIVKPMGG